MLKVFLIAILFAPGGEGYQDFVKDYDTLAQCEAAKKEISERAKQMIGFGFNARCVQVKFGPST